MKLLGDLLEKMFKYDPEEMVIIPEVVRDYVIYGLNTPLVDFPLQL